MGKSSKPPPYVRDSRRRLDAADGYLTLGMPRQALEELGAISTLRDRDWHELQARARAQQQEFATAVKHYRAALVADPADVALSVGLVDSLRNLGRNADALESLENAYELNPDEPELMYEFARHHAQSGNRVLALSWLGRAIRHSQGFRQRASRDPEFRPFRDDPDFAFLIHDAADADT